MDLALTLTIVGTAVVFAALVVLAFSISLLSKAVNLNKNTDKPANVASNNVNVDTISNEVNTNNENDEQLVAVITAAIMASMKHDPDFKIRIKSFRRIPDSSPAWNVAGKLATVNANVR